jgi:hypothetical protein
MGTAGTADRATVTLPERPPIFGQQSLDPHENIFFLEK